MLIFLGKEKLREIKAKGISKKLMGVKIDHDQINVSKAIEIRINSGKSRGVTIWCI